MQSQLSQRNDASKEQVFVKNDVFKILNTFSHQDVLIQIGGF